MAVYLLPQFVVDLQTNGDPHFARQVLRRTLDRGGEFRHDRDDHRYHGIGDAWIKYVGQGKKAFRVIFIRSRADVYLYRAGGHDIEDNLVGPPRAAFDRAVGVGEGADEGRIGVGDALATAVGGTGLAREKRFLRNGRMAEVGRAILGRRNLPHKHIWLVSPFVSADLLLPTARLGKMLLEQAEDGAEVILVTSPPGEDDIRWLERLEERDIGVYCYPRLHSKLYCFVLDENRKFERGLPAANTLGSLLMVGSANMTGPGLGLGEGKWNEEICYSVPEREIGYIEEYVTELVGGGYGLREVRSLRARGWLGDNWG